ncbi:trimethylamine methyltransferase family protein [Halobacterium yunchengense]|uniref:trimethylamine methyltransferase family protein n=1 Tax=Halobacterium yunchengense TaxID=3108497 RepID=UPI00300A7013
MAESHTATSPPGPLEWLDDDAVRTVHDWSMQIVERLGIQLCHPRARELVVENGGSVDRDDVATLPRGVVGDALDAAPETFTLHARNPDNDVVVGGDAPPVRSPGFGPSRVRTAAGGRRDASLADYETLVKLAHAEDAITCAGYNLCEPTDVPREDRHLAMLERSLVLTDKPVMGPTHGSDAAEACMEAVAIATDGAGLSEPTVAGLVNTVPPRRIDADNLGGLLTYADHGQPLVVSSFTMAGASAPPSLPAALAQANAETLVAATLAQLANPGTPVVYGVPSASVDSRYGSLSIGGPESALFAAFAAQLARHYGLPSRGGGGLSDAKLVDYQSGFESTLVNAVTAFSGVDFVLNAAGVLESYSAVSPEKFVLDCEALRALDRLRAGVSTADADVSLDRIAATDPGGHFVDGAGDGAGSFHQAAVVDKRAHDDWATDDRKSAFELGRERVADRLDDYSEPPMDGDARRELESFVASHP